MILFRYLCKEVYLTLLLIMLVLMSVVLINEFSRFLTNVASGQYSIVTAFYGTGLDLSLVITYVLPLALFLAILLGMNRLYANHEMTVIRACGVSVCQQVLCIMSLVCVFAFFSGWLSLWVNPRANTGIQNITENLLSNFQLDTLIPNQFEYMDNTHMIYAKRVSHLNDTITHVFLVSKNKEAFGGLGPNWDVVQAENAYQARPLGRGDSFIILQKGVRYQGVAGSKTLTISAFDRYGVSVSSPVFAGYSTAHSGSADHRRMIPLMMTSALYPLIKHDPLAAAEWQIRIAMPISMIIAPLIALALCEVDPRRGRYINLIPALMLYFVYASTIYLSNSWIQNNQIPIWLGMWWIHVTMLIIALFLFGYRMGWQRIKHLLRMGSS